MSTGFQIADAKEVDEITKLIIFGFIRNMQELKVYIPDLICFMIMIFYMEKEYFDKAGADYKISEDKLSMTRIKGEGWNNSAFFKNWIPSTSNVIIKWIFKATKTEGNVVMGITTDDSYLNKDFTNMSSAKIYAFSSHGWFNSDKMNDIKIHDVWFKTGDTMMLILDLKQRDIFFQINDGDRKHLWSNIQIGDEIKYKFAICLRVAGDIITLTDFSQEFVDAQ